MVTCWFCSSMKKGWNIYFDDTVTGNVANVQLVDTDGDIVAQSDREFEKPPSKGLYVAFKYTIIEKETEVQIESE